MTGILYKAGSVATETDTGKTPCESGVVWPQAKELPGVRREAEQGPSLVSSKGAWPRRLLHLSLPASSPRR